jgi:SH3-like domain-containing protein
MSLVRYLSALLLTGFLFFLVTPLVQAREMVSIARGEVNMRSGPGTRYEAQWGLSRGYPLSVVGRKGGWIKVTDFENDKGWVLRSLTNRTPHHVVKSSIANIRSTPGTRARIVGKAVYGDVLRTLERRGDWVKVRHERGTTGWIARRLVWGW